MCKIRQASATDKLEWVMRPFVRLLSSSIGTVCWSMIVRPQLQCNVFGWTDYLLLGDMTHPDVALTPNLNVTWIDTVRRDILAINNYRVLLTSSWIFCIYFCITCSWVDWTMYSCMRMYVAYSNKTRFWQECDFYLILYSMEYIVQNTTSKRVLSRNVSCQ